tara:strand:+ start:144 stop:416 length:273 start_codon:yes stop_codon:yes gene_type:complete
MSNDLYNTGNYQKAAFGEFGLRQIASGGSSTVGEKYNCIQAMEDSTITCTNAATGGDTAITSLVILSGQIIYGTFHTISCAAGNVIAYIE